MLLLELQQRAALPSPMHQPVFLFRPLSALIGLLNLRARPATLNPLVCDTTGKHAKLTNGRMR